METPSSETKNDSVIKNQQEDLNDDVNDDDVSERSNDEENNINSDNDSDNSDDIGSDIDSDTKSYIDNDELKNKNEKNIEGFLQDEISNYSDSDESSDDEEYYKKLEHSRNLLSNNYKNLQSINYIEIENLSKITRDDNNNIIDDNHKTVPILSKYEKTKILGLRSKQINCGATPFISIEDNIIDGYIIAERELMEKKIPFIIKRPISNNKFEYWKLEDLEIV